MSASMHIPHEELTLYAMQSLAPGDHASVKSHLGECDACRAQLAAIMGDLALVSMSAEQHPLPEGARQRFLDRIGAAPATASNVVSIGGRTFAQAPQTQRSSLIPLTAIAALLLVAAWLGVELHLANLRLQQQSVQIAATAQENQRAREVLDVLNASAAQRVVLTAGSPRPAPSVRVVYLASRGALILQGSNLAEIAPDKTYEFWIIPASGTAPIPAGLFRPDAAGSASLVLPQIPTGVAAKAFGVTVENSAGSSAPTLPIVLSAAAPSPGE